MATLCTYFTKNRKDLSESIPSGLLDSLLRLYDFTVLQEVKESIYNYNEAQISRDISNYLFAINFEPGTSVRCSYTGEMLSITEDFLWGIESRLIGATVDDRRRKAFRTETQRMYAAKTLTQEIMVEGLPITQTQLYLDLHDRYVYNLKERVLDPFLKNENFRNAIKDYGKDTFKTYDKRIREDVTFLIDNLCNKCRYSEKGAKEVCIYVIDNDLARKFETKKN